MQCLVTQNFQNVQVSAGGPPVAGVVSLSADGMQLTFTPQTALATSTQYTVTLNGLCDLAGNSLSGVTSNFSTSASATADTVRPTVTVVPAQGATNVSPDTTVTMTFSEPVDVTTLASGTQMTVSGLSGEVAGELAVNGNVVTFTPTAPLPGNKSITVSVTTAVTDLAGNVVVGVTRTFTTGTATDVVKPQLTSITPNDGAVDIGPNTPIALTFSESLNSTTVNNDTFVLFVNGNVVRPSVARSSDNRTVTLTASLPAASVVAVIVTADVLDLTGNALTDFASVFTTAVATDSARPSVLTQFPSSGSSSVLTDASVVLYTSEAMNEASLAQALHVAQNGQLVGGTISLSASGQAIEFRPLQPWTPGALVEVYLDANARDVNGNALNNFQGSFRLIPNSLTTVPQVVAFDGVSRPTNPVVDVAFNQTLDATTVNGTTATLRQYPSGTVVPSTLSLIKGGRVIRLVPQSPLVTNLVYHYVQLIGGASGIKDTDGQALSGSPQYYFTVPATAVADTVAPKVLAMSPPNGSTGVGINGHVHVQFDEPVNPISLYPELNETTYGSLLWASDDRSVEFARHRPYATSTSITETVAQVEDYRATSRAFRTA